MKNTNTNIKRYIIITIVFIMFQLFFMLFLYYRTVSDIGARSLNIASVVAAHVDVDEFENFLSNREKNNYFNNMQLFFRQSQVKTGVKYIYVQRYIDKDTFEYIFDSEKDSLGELDNMSEEDYKAFTTYNSFSTKLKDYDKWGSLITAYYPIVNKDYKIIAVIGVDVGLNEFLPLLSGNIIAFGIYCLIVTVLFAWLLYRIYRRRKLQEISAFKVFGSIVNVLTKSLAKKSDFTWEHSEKVAKYAEKLAEEMGYHQNDLVLIKWASLLHDIGKIGIPGIILDKPSKLTPEEYEKIKQHPLIGKEILSEIFNEKGTNFNVDQYKIIMDIVSYHHERWDGKGYPFNLKGEEIPLIARILSVADAYEAMLAERPYKKPMSREEAIDQLKKNAGTQFDPKVVEVFLKSKEIY